jgi:hypothetical protein
MTQCLALTRTACGDWPAPRQMTGMARYRKFRPGLGP